VQALPGVGVPAVGGDDERVLLSEAGQRQAALLGVRADVEFFAVERGRQNPLRDQIDERGGARLARTELERRRRPERLGARVPGAVGHVEVQVVALQGQEFGARNGVGTGQVRYGHARQLPMNRQLLFPLRAS
jgi:hypothetical protein